MRHARRVERRLDLPDPFDLVAIARPLSSGFGDPTQHVSPDHWIRATRTVAGPATLSIRKLPDGLRLRAFGPGAAAVLSAAPAQLGLDRPPPPSAGFPPTLRRLARRAGGLRLGRSANWFEPLVLLVLQQKVAGKEAARSYRALVRSISQPAPGPFEDLWLPPEPAALARLPDWAFAPLGIAARQGETLRAAARAHAHVEAASALGAAAAAERLMALPGIGVWTATSLLLHAGGEPDVVPLGDLHLPSHVAFALAGERRADDARMLELLAPQRGLRGWVVRWIETAGETPPRRRPRFALRSLPEGADAALRALRRSRP